MNSFIRHFVLLPVVIALISGCTFTIGEDGKISREEAQPEEIKQQEIKQKAIKQEEAEPEEIRDKEIEEDESSAILVASIDPNLDYSGEVPDCRTAAQRIEDNVQIGMSLADVRRVVGRPRVVFPGSWWWSDGLSLGGRPSVRFTPGLSENVAVSSVSIESSSCR